MKACAYCGTENEDAAETCKDCGTKEFRALRAVPLREAAAVGSGFPRWRLLSGLCGAIGLMAATGFGLHVFPTPIAIGLAHLPHWQLRLALLGLAAVLFGAGSVVLYQKSRVQVSRPRIEDRKRSQAEPCLGPDGGSAAPVPNSRINDRPPSVT